VAVPTIPCDCCGRDEAADDVAHVHRVYVTPASWDAEPRADVQGGVERWCAACRANYPHTTADADEPLA
jgi:hypothetical protein